MPERVLDLPRRDRLSWRLMVIALILACAVGVVLSLGQILFDSRSQSAQIDRSVRHLLAMMREPASEAAYNIDDRLAQRVLDGLSRFDGVVSAKLTVGDDEMLAENSSAPLDGSFRFVTTALFGDRRDYRMDLVGLSGEPVGTLMLQLDTYPPGRAFLERAAMVVVTGLVRAGLLALMLLAVFHLFLTRPLARMAHTLASFDPNAPESLHLDAPLRHERDELGQWAQAVNRLLAAIRENRSHRAEAETRANYLEHFDSLTGIANRSMLLLRATHVIAAPAAGTQLALLIADVREFRDLNAQFGNAFGDDVLRELAQRLQAIGADDSALTARLADDRFALLLVAPQARERAAALADRLLVAHATPFTLGSNEIALQLKIGIAVFPDDAQSAEQLVQNAERALAIAKKQPLESCQFYQAEQDKELQARKRLARDLRVALQQDEITIHYQPIVAADGGQIVAVEALARWQHPVLGDVPPAQFIPLAESGGQILALGEWVLHEACRQAAHWQRLREKPLRIAVNVSPLQLRERGFEFVVEAALSAARLPPSLLEIEITETAIIENIEQAIGTLERLRSSGVRISVDDFGTGHASLTYLKRLPIDQLKIDLSFIRDLMHDPDDAQIVKAIINLGHSLDLEVVAEGVEDMAQLDFLEANRCDLVQGFLLKRPLPAAAFTEYLQRMSAIAAAAIPINARRLR